MNSKTCLHLKYIFQNLKKSRSILALILFLFPLIASLIQLADTNMGVVDLFGSSGLITLGMFVIPILLSLLLFSFLYKRKKVDFIIGMPLSRKQIFISNTLAGIVLIILMFLMNILFLFLFSCFNQNIVLNSSMVLDYLLVYGLGYISVFTTTNVAMSLVGNTMTQIIVTLLLLFLIPFFMIFHQQVLNGPTRLVEYDCSGTTCEQIAYDQCVEQTGIENCDEQAKENYYYTTLNKGQEYHGMVSTQAVITFVSGTTLTYDTTMLLKTFLWSIVMIFVGFFTFQKRKMEQCETSFTSFHVHTFVKCLTLFPLGIFLFLVQPSFRDALIIILVYLAYFFIYDLITQKRIQKIKISLGYFLITLLLASLYSYGMEAYINSKKMPNFDYVKETLTVENIEGIRFSSLNAYDMNVTSGYRLDQILFTDEQAKETILQYAFQNTEGTPTDLTMHYSIILKDGNTYYGYLTVTEEQRQKLLETLQETEQAKNYTTLKESDIQTVNFLEENYTYRQLQPILSEVVESLDAKANNTTTPGEVLSVVIYKNHQLMILDAPNVTNQTVLDYLMRKNNERTLEGLAKEKIQMLAMESSSPDEESLTTDDRNILEDMVKWIKEDGSSINSKEPYDKIYLYGTHSYIYVTNNDHFKNYLKEQTVE